MVSWEGGGRSQGFGKVKDFAFIVFRNLPLLEDIKDFLPYIIPVAVARLGEHFILMTTY